MKQLLLSVFAAIIITSNSFAQCTKTQANTCVCPPGGSATDCDLLPDIKVSRDPIVNGGYTVYAQTGNPGQSQGSNDGRLRLTGTTPNIGYGPMETRTINKWVCGPDTVYSDPGNVCTNGFAAKRMLVQRIYHKNGNTMTYQDIESGTMTYHQSHGHMHVDDWSEYTLRLQDPNEPDPTKWSIVGNGAKLAFCLLDIGSCNSNPGYCRDDNNNPQTTTQIPNNTIGAGSYGCSSTLQGISNGYYDTYSQSLDGMWIDIPPGTCNGNYYIVVRVDQNNNFIEMNENNNVIAVPITISNQASPGNPSVSIFANKPPAIASTDSIKLTATGGLSYLWSTGQTSQSIWTNRPGQYTCTVTNYCGTATSAPFDVSVTNALFTPVGVDGTTCTGSTADLSASNLAGDIMRWYSSPTSTTPLATGSTFTTPVLNSTTTYYVQSERTTTGGTYYTGPVDHTFGNGAFQTSSTTQYLEFHAFSNFTLKSVKVNANVSGNRTFQLLDRGSVVLRTLTVNVPAGVSRVNLNFDLVADMGYRLQVSGTPNLYYNNSNVNYPYMVGGVCQIIGSYAGHSTYPYFYDFEIKVPDLNEKSARTAVTAFVNNNVNVTLNTSATSICAGQQVTITASGANSYVWTPGGYTTPSITVSPISTTSYSVTGSIGNCTDIQSVSITVNPLPVIQASSNGPVCSGNLFQLNCTAGFSYAWTGPLNFSSTLQNPSIASALSIHNGTYTVVATDANNCSSSSSVNLLVKNNPSVTISGTNVSCNGGTNGSATAAAFGGSSPYSYSWDTNPVQTSSTASNLVSGVYTVTVTDANNCTATNSTGISQPQPLSGSASITHSGCSGSNSGAVTLSVSGGTPPYTYAWSNGASTQNISNLAAGTYNALITDANGCTASVSATVSNSGSAPGAPASVTGQSIVCTNTSGVNFSTLPVPNATSYQWSLPSGASISSGQGTTAIQVNFSGSATNGNVCVYASNGCGNSASTCFTVTVATAKPNTPLSIDGSNIICPGTTGNLFSCPPIANAQSYIWTLPSGLTLTSGLGTSNITVSVSSSFSQGYLRVKASNCHGNSTDRIITVYGKPTTPGSISGQNTTVCAGSTINYAIPNVNSATSYLWTAPANSTIIAGQGTTNITINYNNNFVSGTLAVRSENQCGTSGNRTRTIYSVPVTPTSITGPSSVCANQSGVMYSCTPMLSATSYTWDFPVGTTITSGQGSNTVTVDVGTSSNYISVWSNNACGSSTSPRKLLMSITCRESSELFSVNVYPNPASEDFTCSFTAKEIAHYKLSLTDITGKEVLHNNITSIIGTNNINVSVKDLSKGLYFLRLENNDRQLIEKVILD